MYLDEDQVACPAHMAELVLVEVGVNAPVSPCAVPYLVSWAGESTLCVISEVNGTPCAYAVLERLYAFTPKIMAAVGAAISGNLRAGLSCHNHRDFYGMEYNLCMSEARQVTPQQVHDTVRQMPVSRITQDHHLFVNRQEIFAVYKHLSEDGDDSKSERLAAAKEILDVAGRLDLWNRVSAITFLLYVAVAPLFAVRHLMWCISICDTPKQLNTVLKREGQSAKQMQTIFRDDLASVFELLVLRNRIFNHVDWEEEREHRVRPKLAPIDPQTVYKLAAKQFRIAQKEGRSAKRLTWRRYWRERWSTLPTGSVVSQYTEDRELKASLPREARVKAAWFAANMNSDHRFWLDREPAIYASTSTKYEWGKVRALYGCDVTSFLHSDFAMRMVEDTLPAYFPVGSRANDEYVSRTLERMNYGVPFCYDYDDFNSQHSIRNMQAVVIAWRDVYSADLTEEQKLSLQWTVESIENQRVKFGELGYTERICGTLLSGWRLTSFINTVLNRVYLELAGIKKMIYAVHNGDDMYASCTTVSDAMRVVRKGREIGIRAQVSKTNIGTIGEFLRVDARAKVKTSAQYLARAVATCVHGRVETGKPNDAQQAAKAVITRTDAIIERGGSRAVAIALREQQLEFITRLFHLANGFIQAAMRMHPIQGGWDESADICDEHIMARREHDVSDEYRGKFRPIKKGVYDYCDDVAVALNVKNEAVDRKLAYERAVDALLRNKVGYEIVIEPNPERMRVLRGLYKVWAGDKMISDLAKSRALGIGPVAAIRKHGGGLASMLSHAKDPMEILAIAT